jgi:hypothetical protein
MALFLPLFGLYLVLSLHYLGPPNWTAAAYLGGIVLLAAKWLDLATVHRWARWLAIVCLALAAVETAILLETRWLHLSHRLDPLDRARGSRSLAAAVAQRQQSTGAQFVIADNYMTASLLSFYLPGQPETFVPRVTRPLNQLELWSTYDQQFPAGDALIVAKRSTLPRSLGQSFTQLKPLGSFEAIDGSRRVGKFYLFLGQRTRRTDGDYDDSHEERGGTPSFQPGLFLV